MKKFLFRQTLFLGIIYFIPLFSNYTQSFAQKTIKGIRFSHSSGFYEAPFDLLITSENIDAELYYTIDGSNPANSTTRIPLDNISSILIDPTIDSIRPTTPAFIVRAIGMLADSIVIAHVAQTYIFLSAVKTQTYPGGVWPVGNVNGQFIDLDMDQDVIEHANYADLMDEALLDIPSISVVSDHENIFSSSNGIYVNAHGHGKQWERPCSIELIDSNGGVGFYENAGIRIRGGWSRHPEFAKHAFRIFFREEYGADKLRFPLFEDEGVDEFDKIDLRCAQNYAWSNDHGEHNTFVREVFARDSQGEMGHPYTRSRYYHLYLNGMYWGLFQTQERSEARYAASYLGANKEDYDVVKVNTDYYQYEIEATDGNLDKWNMIWERSRSSFAPNGSYFELEGKNSVGKPVPGQEVLVDVDNLIDYMIIIFYTGSFDAPVTQFQGNDYPNNFYAIKSREDKSMGFKFFAHDLEHSLMIDPVTVGKGLYEDRVNIATASGEDKMEITQSKYFNPQWLHYRLSANKEYQLRFADRAAKHLTNNGVFTQESATKRFNKRASQIELAIIGESARWGDTRVSIPYTRDNAWIRELDDIKNRFFPKRTRIVIDQLKRAGLYASLSSPLVIVSDTIFDRNIVNIDEELSIIIENPNGSGEIFYALNGQDPRLIGGYLNKNAIPINNRESMVFDGSALMNIRIKDDDTWSALRTLTLVAEDDDLANLKITEIHYHPEDHLNVNDTLKSKDLEFLEFKNIGETGLNLSGVKIDSAIQYTFPENTILPPGQFYVIASKPSKFYEKYGLLASGNYKGNLSNDGEQIVVFDRNSMLLLDFTYDINNPWPDKADGTGPSLASIDFNPTGNPSEYAYWRPSIYQGGTPFRDDELITAIEELNEISHSKTINIFPNPPSGVIHISVPSLAHKAMLNITVYDLNGHKLMSETIMNHGELVLSKNSISSGIKIITIEHDQLLVTSKILLNN